MSDHALMTLLYDIDRRDRPSLGVMIDDSPARRLAMKRGYLWKRKMNSGHGWIYGLTEEGRKLL